METEVNGNRIIDMHCHTAGLGYGKSGCFISNALRTSWRFKVYLRAFGVSEDELRRFGDIVILKRLSLLLANSRCVSEAVVLAMDGVVGKDGELDAQATEIYIPNEFIAGNVGRFGNIIYGASINPYRRDSLERLDKAKEDGAVLIKWLPPVQNIDPSGKCIVPFYKRLQELGLPLLSHTGDESSFTKSQNELADPERLRLPLDMGVTVIAAHAAAAGKTKGERNLDRLLSMFGTYKNLYADISALTQVNRPGQLATLLRRSEAHDRLLYGSDMPLLRTGLVSPFYFSNRISLKIAVSIARIRNPWDQDVRLKQALGVPGTAFSMPAEILKINKNKSGERNA
jgi:hypothetical protein